MDEDEEIYQVVVNHEEQYSIWPQYRDIPAGWREVGVSGKKKICLDHIEQVWTDMRPLSLRKKMEELKNSPPPPMPSQPVALDEEEPTLVERLSSGSHPVEISLRPRKELNRLKECLDRGFVHVKFTNTRGGTELGVRLIGEESELTHADFVSGTGSVSLVGTLTLDFVKVRCHATIRLTEMVGEGHLTPA